MASTLPIPAVIYSLESPLEPGVVRYIGKTMSGRLGQRLAQHIKEVDRRNTPKNAWIKSLLRQGVKPIAAVVELCDSGRWEGRERFWIGHFRESGKLTNATDGGDTGPDMTGYRHSDESKAKIAKRSRLMKWSDERKQRLSVAMRGRKMKPEWIAAMRASKRKLAELGDTSWKCGIEAAIAKNTGSSCPPERAEKIRLAQLGRKPTTGALLASMEPVVCVETGTWFASSSEAMKRCGTSVSAISNVFSGRAKTAAGFHWKKANKQEDASG